MLLAGTLALLSNSAGRGSAAGQGATGAPGDGLTCASSNCHGSAGPFAAQIDIALSKDGEAVDQYVPGETYTMSITVDATSGTPSRYGFQMTAIVGDNSGAGSFSEVSSNAQAINLNGRAYLEHNGPSNSETFTATWTAPEEGSGDVTVFAAGIAANGNGGTSGDSGATASVTISEDDLSNVKVLTSDEMSFYPNPAIDFIKVDTELNQSMVFDVLSTSGAKVMSGNLKNNSIDISNLTNGLYIVAVSGEDFIYRQKIYKR